MKKRIVGILLCILMLASILPLQAAAGDETLVLVRESFGADYTFESGKIYRICENGDGYVAVEKGVTLTVEPGAIIEFGVNGNVHGSGDRNKGDRLIVRGTLRLLGTAGQPVIVRPQYTGDWANCTGIVLEPDETGGEVSLEAAYTSFTGGGMEGRGWMGGVISVHHRGDAEQSFSLELDHCSVQGSSHPWEYPDVYNSPDGDYPLGFNPDQLGVGVYVSADGTPVDAEITNCTFGAPDAPLGSAIMDSDYTTNACHRWHITNCTFTNCRDTASKAHNRMPAVISVDAPAEFVMTGCSVETSDSLPVPLYLNTTVSFRAKTGGEYKISGNEMSFAANEHTYSDTVYGVGYTNLPACLSGAPLNELKVDSGVLTVGDVTGEGMRGFSRFDLCIADGGRIDVAEGAEIQTDLADGSSYFRLHLGRGATVNGLDLFESDGETKIGYPTSEEMLFVYVGKSYSGEPYRYIPKGRWVRVTEEITPATGVGIAEGEEIWITSGATEYSVLHASALPENATDDAAYWIESFNRYYTGELIWDRDLKCYKPGLLKIIASSAESSDATLIAYSRDNASFKTITVHFRPSDDPEMTSVTGVTLPGNASLEAGGTLKLTATVEPENATTKNVWWESDDDRVLTVDQNGVVTAIGEGTATVTVTTTDCPTSASCIVTVTEGDECPHTTVNTAHKEPTCTEPGSDSVICRNCGAILSETPIPALGHDFGADGKAEKCSRCGAPNPDFKPALNFKDVPADAYYAAPVAWAVEKNITTGTSSTTFSPEEGCTRGQVVTFLWRAAGQPEPTITNNPFKDVKADDYFYKAVMWAVEKEVTTGTSATAFSPDDVCTRGQIVTFLWRANGKPAPSKTSNPFKDVKSGDYFYSAVLWAVERGITLGTDATHFSPSDTCTRGQVVTFLYRAVKQ